MVSKCLIKRMPELDVSSDISSDISLRTDRCKYRRTDRQTQNALYKTLYSHYRFGRWGNYT